MKQEEIDSKLAAIAGRFYVLSQKYLSGLTANEMQDWEFELEEVASQYETLREEAGE